MKNILLATLAAFAAISATHASPLTPDEALGRVSADGPRAVRAKALTSPVLLATYSDAEALPAIYIFSNGADNGFMIVSADDAAIPLLGYSDTGTFNPANLPPQLASWLNGYKAQIATARANGVTATANQVPELPDMAPVDPLLKSKWNQGAPYNRYCYFLESATDSTQSVTGCVATAMAQVMYYFGQPAVGQGEISYRHGDSGTYTMNFANQDFNWSEMLPTYYPDSYTKEQSDAVAYLMKACGYSVKMDYGKGESGASGANIPGALIKYFGYKGGMRLETRKFWTYTDWAQMIHENLTKVGPVIYDGDALDGGHSFVCDGYDGNGYFHFNWGWGGMADGYYLLDALNPDEYGIGGAAGGYNLGQQIILGITPDDTDIFPTHVMQFGNARGSLDGSTLSLGLTDGSNVGFQYINPQEITLTFGLLVENLTDSTQETQYFESEKKDISVSQSDFYTWDEVGRKLDLANVKMTEGDEYAVEMATLITTTDGSHWEPTVPMTGYSNRVTITKDASGYHVTNYEVPDIEVNDFSVVSDPVYLNMPVKFQATFANNADTELTRNYSGELFDTDGNKVFTMENFSVTLSPNTTETIEWSSVEWYKAKDAGEVTTPAQFTLRLYDNWQGKYVDVADQTVTVEATPASPEVEATLSLENGDDEDGIYIVEGDNLEVSVTVTVKSGLFNKPILLEVQKEMPDGKFYSIEHKRFDVIPYLTEGESATYSMTMTVSDVEYEKEYRLEATGDGIKLEKPLLVKFDMESGIEKVSLSGQSGPFTVYSLQGIRVMKADSPEQLHSLSPGIYIVNGKKTLIRN